MKKLVVILMILSVAPLVVAGQFKIKGSIRPDPLRGENHYLIYNKHGKAKAKIAPDPIRSNQYQIFDKNGNQTGRIKPDAIRPDSWIIKTVKDLTTSLKAVRQFPKFHKYPTESSSQSPP